MHNIELEKRRPEEFESKFGFEVETCCGSIPQSNKWDVSWTVSLHLYIKLFPLPRYTNTTVGSVLDMILWWHSTFAVILYNEAARADRSPW